MKSLAQQYKRCIYEAILKAIRKPHKCPSSKTSKNNQFQVKVKNTPLKPNSLAGHRTAQN